MLNNRSVGVLLALALTAGLGYYGLKVKTDYSVEHYFPVWDPARQVYDHYKEAFPYEDASALVIVEAVFYLTSYFLRK